MLQQYYSDVSEKGLTAEFKYLDNSKKIFWNPPRYNSTLTYNDLIREVTNNSKIYKSLSYKWDTLNVFSLTNSIANYSGIVKGEMIDTLGRKTVVKLLESGSVIKRKNRWKILNCQTTIINMESLDKVNNKNLFICYIKLDGKYLDTEKWTDDTHKIIKQHSAYLDSLGKKGILVFAGRTRLNPSDKRMFGIAVFKAQSLEGAKKLISTDPAVVNNIQKVTILPLSLGKKHFQNLE